jgi:xanthine/CO dehydrogenase XdhC/CoxF family maturation factor
MAMNQRVAARLDTSLELLLERAPLSPDPCVLATVVATSGSTYRKPGARMLIMADGSYIGLLTGGCFESDLGIHAQEVLQSGVARAVEYDIRGPDDALFGIGAGCEGAMRVLLESAGAGTPAANALAVAGRATHAGGAASLVMVHEASDLSLGTFLATPPLPAALIAAGKQSLADRASRAVEFGTAAERARAFVQYLAPPPHLLICGGGPDSQCVVSTARTLGWQVSVVDHRPAFATAGRFPGAVVRLAKASSLRSVIDLPRCHAAVVMSHHLVSDEAYLRELAEAGVPAYVGLLGPAARRRHIAEELGPLAKTLDSRIFGPVGTDIGAITPEGIALAIISQIHAWLAGRGTALLAVPQGFTGAAELPGLGVDPVPTPQGSVHS